MNSIDWSFSSSLQARVLNNIAGETPSIQWSKIEEKWPHLIDVPSEQVSRRRQIDVMIGSDHPLFHLVLKDVSGSQPTNPIARLTNLGWVCFGPTLVVDHRKDSRVHFTRTYRSCHNQDNQQKPPVDILRQFWELESIGIKYQSDPPMTTEGRAATTQVSRSLEFKEGRYELGMAWKDGEPKLDNNFEDSRSFSWLLLCQPNSGYW